MQYGYVVAFNDGTTSDGVANTRDVALWEVSFGKHHADLTREGVFFYEFAWLAHAAEKRQDRTTLDLLPWLDTVADITPQEVDPLDPLATAPVESSPSTGS